MENKPKLGDIIFTGIKDHEDEYYIVVGVHNSLGFSCRSLFTDGLNWITYSEFNKYGGKIITNWRIREGIYKMLQITPDQLKWRLYSPVIHNKTIKFISSIKIGGYPEPDGPGVYLVETLDKVKNSAGHSFYKHPEIKAKFEELYIGKSMEILYGTK